MKISIITVVYNGERFIESCIRSVLSQTHPDVEYIVIDGASTDGTMDIVRKYEGKITKVVSEPDKGIYDAMNKGVRLATGEVVGILNADDFYHSPDVLEKVAAALETSKADCLFADLIFINPERPEKIVRYYSGSDFKVKDLEKGHMPPHPTFFVRKEHYNKLGLYDTRYRITADFDLMVRYLYKKRISFHYLPEILVTMRTGGVSTSGFRSTIKLNNEILDSCRRHGLPTSKLKIYSKYLKKIRQFI